MLGSGSWKDLEGLCVQHQGRRRVWAGDGEGSAAVRGMDGRGSLDAQIPSRTVMEELNQGGGNRKTGMESR